MATCRTCKYIVRQGTDPNKAWCVVWNEWQKGNANSCKHFLLKPTEDEPKQAQQSKATQIQRNN